MGDAILIDSLTGALTDPFNRILMGVTAENVAERYAISREEQDALAVLSHKRAQVALTEGRFKDQILPIEVKTRGKVIVFDTDEHVRMDVSADQLASLRPIFKKDGGTVTAGNSSGVNDGAAAVALASRSAVEKYGLRPMAKLVSYAHSGVDPAYMGIGPVTATRLALKRAGLSVDDLGVIESNEAFAAQACAVSKILGFDPEKVNPNGSGISLGHPVGATGVRLLATVLSELERRDAERAMIAVCAGGAMATGMIVERM